MRKALWSFLYLGYFPHLPGTAGSLGGLLVYLVLIRLPGEAVTIPLAAGVMFFAAVWGGREAAAYFDEKDPRPCVLDEGCGAVVSLIAIRTVPVWEGAVLGFVLFRLYDVAKPFPIRRVEKVAGGWGIALDDVLAGVCANVSCRALLWLSAAIATRLH